MNEVVREFLLETHENLAQLDLDLVSLEKEPTGRETLGRVFRTLHTVKGTAGFLGLPKLQGLAHASETLLSRLRAEELLFNAEIASALLEAVDGVHRILAALEVNEQEGDGNYADLIKKLEHLTTTGSLAGMVLPSFASPTLSGASVLPHSMIVPPPSAPVPVSPPPPAVTPAVAAPSIVSPPKASLVLPPPPPPPVPVIPAAPAPETAEVAPADNFTEAEGTQQRTSAVSDSSIRVDVGLLDKLMNLVGELVLARNQIMQFSTSQEDTTFLGTVQRLNLLTTELQANVMKTRMQPIGNLWAKFPRIVRDLALACGKQVRLDMEGQETELDKTIIEAIRDPLTHMIRNAIDHGIEPPTERAARGKLAEGRLSIHAFHEGGKVIIEINDDGGGIDPHRVREKAIQTKVLTPEQADRLNDREVINLIFLAGFSTADRVTHFSGRGVGMDVVRTNIEKIGGTVDVQSQLGRGTTVKMKIPLTLAIIPALTIASGGDRYAIPQVSLLELVRLEGEQAQQGIELIHGSPVCRLRGNLLPLVYLNRVLQVEAGEVEGATESGEINIVVLQADDRQFGLVVDKIHDTEEIVVKPLQKQLKGVSAFAGATIMGDGKVALILDVLGLAQRAKVVSGVRERALTEKATGSSETAGDRQTVLLFAAANGGRMAIPLVLVARLEEFPRSALERVGVQDVVQYRGEILPLIQVSRVLRAQRGRKSAKPSTRYQGNGQTGYSTTAPPSSEGRLEKESSDTIQVVVYADQSRRVGLVVSKIIDIVEEEIQARAPANRPGVLFSAVVQGRVTEFLDVEGIIRSAGMDMSGGTGAPRSLLAPAPSAEHLVASRK